MKWAFSLENKVKASVTLLLLCGIVFFSNYRIKKLSAKVAASVQTIYEDRLIVQDLIFKYSKILNEFEDPAKFERSENELKQISLEIDRLNDHYLTTVLTSEEEIVFNSFKDNLAMLITVSEQPEMVLLTQMKKELERLGQIQLEEAGNQMDIIQRASGSQELGYYLETAILIILLFIIQALMISNVGVRRVIKGPNFNLN